jgi:hypothetical protein
MIIRIFLTLSLYNGIVAGWTYTRYWTIGSAADQLFTTSTDTYAEQVYPTGSVSPTSTDFTTITDPVSNPFGYFYYPVTITDFYVPSTASVCTADSGCPGDPHASTATMNDTSSSISTRYFAPYTITQPTTCTKTSFLYTASTVVYPTDLDGYENLPGIDIAAQATQTAEAVLVTTYVVTVSTDLGGQVVAMTECDVFLKDGAAVSLGPNEAEQGYLAECVDPRRYLCSDAVAANGGCPTGNWAYPPVGGSGSRGGGAATTSSQRGEGSGFVGLASRGLAIVTLIWSLLGVAMCIGA